MTTTPRQALVAEYEKQGVFEDDALRILNTLQADLVQSIALAKEKIQRELRACNEGGGSPAEHKRLERVLAKALADTILTTAKAHATL